MLISNLLTRYTFAPIWARFLLFLGFYLTFNNILYSSADCTYCSTIFYSLEIKPITSLQIFEPIQIYIKIPFYMVGDYEILIEQKQQDINFLNSIVTNHIIMLGVSMIVIFLVQSNSFY